VACGLAQRLLESVIWIYIHSLLSLASPVVHMSWTPVIHRWDSLLVRITLWKLELSLAIVVNGNSILV
jgi:hypothetical protein